MRELTKYPVVAIIMPNWNGKSDTLECLDSIKKLEYPKNKIEIIISDNGSADGSYYAIKEKFEEMDNENYRNLKIIQNGKNIGATGALNSAYEASSADADYILKLDNDIVLDSFSLIKSIIDLENDNKIGIIGGKIFCYRKPQKIVHAAGFINWWLARDKKKHEYNRSINCDYVNGCYSLIRKSVIKEMGIFLDNSYFVYFDDVDLCIRIKKSKYKVVYNPDVIIYHKISATTKKQERSMFSIYFMNRNRMMFFRKHSPFLCKLFSLPIIYTTESLKILLVDKNKFKKMSVFFSAVVDGLVTNRNNWEKINLK